MGYIRIHDLQAYKQSISLSKEIWGIYTKMDWRLRKLIGDQIVRSCDSIGANIAEGYGRYHYLDKIRFFYNARGSLLETEHWIDLCFEREIIIQKQANDMKDTCKTISITLNGLIKHQYRKKTT